MIVLITACTVLALIAHASGKTYSSSAVHVALTISTASASTGVCARAAVSVQLL
jgi:hypothetical protein